MDNREESQRVAVDISPQEKEILLSFAKRIDPQDAGAHNNLAVVYYNKGLYEEAIAELKRALVIDPSFALARDNLQVIYRKIGEKDLTLETLVKNALDNPYSFDDQFALAEGYMSSGKLEEAAQTYRIALEINNNHLKAILSLGLVLKKLGQFEESASVYRKAMEIGPDNPEVHTNLGEVYFNIGLLDQSIIEFKKALELDPNCAEAHFLLGFAYGEKGMLDLALSEAKIASKLNPNYSKAEVNLGIDFYKKQREEIDRTPEQEYLAHYNLGLAFRNKGLFDEALKEIEIAGSHLKKVKEPTARRRTLLKLNGEIFILKGEYEKGLSSLEECQSIAGETHSGDILNALGVALQHMGRLEEAIKKYQEGRENSKASVVNLGVCLYAFGKKDEGMETLKHSIIACEGNLLLQVSGYYNLGLLHFFEGMPQEAEREFISAIKLKPKFAYAHSGLGLLYLHEGRTEEALREFKEVTREEPNFAEGHYHLSFALSRMEKYEEALEEAKQAIAIEPQYSFGRFLLPLELDFDCPERLFLWRMKSIAIKETETTTVKKISDSSSFESKEEKVDFALLLNSALEDLEKGLFKKSRDIIKNLLSEADRIQRMDVKFDGLLMWGRGCFLEGALEEAEGIFQNALSLGGDGSSEIMARLFLAKTRLLLGKLEDAKKECEAILSSSPSHSEALLCLGEIYIKEDKDDEALSVLSKVTDAEIGMDTKAKALFLLGEVLRKMGSLDDARKKYEEAITLEPQRAVVHLRLGEIFLTGDKVDEAEREFKMALSIVPTSVEGLLGLGEVMIKKGMLLEAKSLYEKVLLFDANNVRAELSLAAISYRTGDMDETKTLIDNLISREPSNPEVLYWLGLLKGYENEIDEAIDIWLRAESICSEGKVKDGIRRALGVAVEWRNLLKTQKILR